MVGDSSGLVDRVDAANGHSTLSAIGRRWRRGELASAEEDRLGAFDPDRE